MFKCLLVSITKERKLKKTVPRFVALGIINTILDFALFNILRVLTNTTSDQVGKLIVLNIISASSVAVFSFFMSRSYVFEQKDTKTHMIIPFIATNLFGIFVLQSAIISLLLGPLYPLAEVMQSVSMDLRIPLLQNASINFFDSNLAKLFATLVTLVWNFVIYNFVIFKREPKAGERQTEQQ